MSRADHASSGVGGDPLELRPHVDESSRVPSGRRILLVEDDFTTACDLALCLESVGYDVTLATDKLLTVSGILSSEEKPDLVLMQLMLPEEGGLWAAERLRILDETRHIPVVFLSRDASASLQEKAESLGAAFFSLPCDREELLSCVATILSHPERELPGASEIWAELDKIAWLSRNPVGV